MWKKHSDAFLFGDGRRGYSRTSFRIIPVSVATHR
jgi:hypothetical protein